MSVPRSAMILAAGRGERMAPLTHGRAKPTLPVLGMPLVERILRGLAAAGVREASINAHHAPESIRDAIDAGAVPGLATELHVEERLMGSGGALAAPAERLAAADSFVLHNGDTLVDAPLERLAEAARKGGKRIGALLVRPGRVGRYRPVAAKDGKLAGLDGEGDAAATYLGVAVLRRAVLDAVPRDRPSSLFPDVLLPLVDDGAELALVSHEGRWLEFTSPESYGATLLRLVHSGRRPGRVALPGGDAPLTPSASGATFAAADARVGTGASVSGAIVLERGARVATGAVVEDAVLLEGASVANGVFIKRAVVGAGAAVLGPRQLIGGTLSREDGGTAYRPAAADGRDASPEAFR